MPVANRFIAVCAFVATVHALGLWMVQIRMPRTAVDLVVPIQLTSLAREESPTVKAPVPLALPTAASARPIVAAPVRRTAAESPVPSRAVADMPAPSAEQPAPTATGAPAAPATGAVTPHSPTVGSLGGAQISTAPGIAVPAATGSGGQAATAEGPSVAASYQHRPLPPYPPLSKRLGEQGTTLVEVWIGTDGLPQQASVRKSSGFDRLDRASVDAVMAWRYNPGKRGTSPQAMAILIPVRWVQE